MNHQMKRAALHAKRARREMGKGCWERAAFMFGVASAVYELGASIAKTDADRSACLRGAKRAAINEERCILEAKKEM